MGNHKNANSKNAIAKDKTIRAQGGRNRFSMFAMFSDTGKTAKTLLVAGIFMVIVGSCLLNSPSFPRWLPIIILVLGVIWNVIAGLLYRDISKHRD